MKEDTMDTLNRVQQTIDENTSVYVQEDFKLKLRSHQKVLEVLAKRDKILKEELTREELSDFFSKIFENFEPLQEYVPVKEDKSFDISFIKFLRADYLEDYKMKVTLELYENEYVENKVLEKTMHLSEGEPETTKVCWKGDKGRCPLFDFFENDYDDFESFDIFYEFYMHMLFLAEDMNDDE